VFAQGRGARHVDPARTRRQIATALMMYAQDYDENLPGFPDPQKNPSVRELELADDHPDPGSLPEEPPGVGLPGAQQHGGRRGPSNDRTRISWATTSISTIRLNAVAPYFDVAGTDLAKLKAARWPV